MNPSPSTANSELPPAASQAARIAMFATWKLSVQTCSTR
jgi:hypothetical protein